MTIKDRGGPAVGRIVGKGIVRVVTRLSRSGVSPRCQVVVFFDDDTACEIYGNDLDIARNLDTAARWRERIRIGRDYEVLVDTADRSC